MYFFVGYLAIKVTLSGLGVLEQSIEYQIHFLYANIIVIIVIINLCSTYFRQP